MPVLLGFEWVYYVPAAVVLAVCLFDSLVTGRCHE